MNNPLWFLQLALPEDRGQFTIVHNVKVLKNRYRENINQSIFCNSIPNGLAVVATTTVKKARTKIGKKTNSAIPRAVYDCNAVTNSSVVIASVASNPTTIEIIIFWPVPLSLPPGNPADCQAE